MLLIRPQIFEYKHIFYSHTDTLWHQEGCQSVRAFFFKILLCFFLEEFGEESQQQCWP